MDPLSGLNIGGAGATTSKMALPEGLSRDESEAEIDEVRKRYATHEGYSRSGLVKRAQDLQFDVQHGLESDPNEDPDGDARLAAWQQRYGYPISLVPGFITGRAVREKGQRRPLPLFTPIGATRGPYGAVCGGFRS